MLLRPALLLGYGRGSACAHRVGFGHTSFWLLPHVQGAKAFKFSGGQAEIRVPLQGLQAALLLLGNSGYVPEGGAHLHPGLPGPVRQHHSGASGVFVTDRVRDPEHEEKAIPDWDAEQPGGYVFGRVYGHHLLRNLFHRRYPKHQHDHGPDLKLFRRYDRSSLSSKCTYRRARSCSFSSQLW